MTMSQLHRFYVPDLARQPESVALPEDELHHALRVVRVRAGDRVQLFDGAGRWSDAEVIAADRRDVSIVRGPLHEDAPGPPRLALGQAWLNHERANESIVQRATELGVDRIVFFRAAHSERGPKNAEKWVRWSVESCKQCGRNRLPQIAAVTGLADCLAAANGLSPLIATQHAPAAPLDSVVRANDGVLLLVGPEGDFTPEEVQVALKAGARVLSLGPRTLRSEVAATVAIALVQHRLGRLGPGEHSKNLKR
jgi:16S rRNA (uracil1498-N3)-methyltransferase